MPLCGAVKLLLARRDIGKSSSYSESSRRTLGICRINAVGYDVRDNLSDRTAMTTLNPAVARVLKRLHYPLEVILTCVRWYVAYPLSLRHLEE